MQFPIKSKLTYDIFIKAERVMRDSNYVILQINAQSGTEFYEPYLLFYNTDDLKLESYHYNPGKVVSVNNKTILGYYNQFRSEKTREKLKNGYNFYFEAKEPTHVRKKSEGKILSYEIKNDSIYLEVKDTSVIKNLNYHVNDVVFSDFRTDDMDVYFFSDSLLTYKSYKVAESKLKESIWTKVIVKSR
jgi:hypothetical protein